MVEGKIFELGGGFVVVVVMVEVEILRLGVEFVVRMVLWCSNNSADFL